MASAEDFSPSQDPPMAKGNTNSGRSKATSFLSDGFLFVGGALVAFLVVWALWSFFSPPPPSSDTFSTAAFPDRKSAKFDNFATSSEAPESFLSTKCPTTASASDPDPGHDPPDPTFYDDPNLTYTIDSPPVKNWDEKRRRWLEQHPSFAAAAEDRILIVTGSQATPCKNQIGDYLLLKFFKNKVDYARRHGIDVFYNNVLLQPQMFSFWAKTPTVKAAMLAHPEVEWIWWIDSDAAFTDMDFVLPLDRYKSHNLVIHGWPDMIFEKKSWTSINAGVFLIRNCQWAMEFMDAWSKMGPQAPQYDKWGQIQRSIFKDKSLPESDDQTGLLYLIVEEQEKWGKKIYIERDYYFEGYWLEIVGTLENISENYAAVEKEAAAAALRRRHAEKVGRAYGEVWAEVLKKKGVGYGRGSGRRPFITHFTGCQPCSGDHNQMYSGQTCFDAMQKALTFADNQVLRDYGYVHPDLLDPAAVAPLPFDYPASL
ncbi:putative glycosyltransferase 7 [Andrographis paniculata]|uniref:putative glycosyltransferase 7 n=1 Tax=Andrographis paniculata TaxID=175694 RepID=UPI0021E73FE4|nr:putative glycosyltransferase 7 [Andrographis paniculata]